MSRASTIAGLKASKQRDQERAQEELYEARRRQWRREHPEATVLEIAEADRRIRQELGIA